MTDEAAGSPAGDATFQTLRHQIEQTRSAIAGKLESLQKRVTMSVDSACAAVDETVHSAKRSTQDAVQAIQCALDLKRQATRHPWAMMGVATWVGVLLARRRRDAGQSAARKPINGPCTDEVLHPSETVEATAARPEPLPEQPGTKQWLSARLHCEVNKVRDAAIAAGVNIFRDWLERMMRRTKNETPGK